MKAIESWYSKLAEADMEEEKLPFDEWVLSVAIVVFGILIVLFFVAHQTWSTGFFTAEFGMLEMLTLYGSLFYWITTSGILLLGYKDPSRDFDSYGGLMFATVSHIWLLVAFPFEFPHFADVMPDFLRFLVQWISNDIARVLMVLGFIVHLVLAVHSTILRLFVRKVRAQKDL